MSTVTLDTVFHSQVEASVQASVSSNKPLIVYLAPASAAGNPPESQTEANNSWINTLITSEILAKIDAYGVGLKLVETTQQFLLFKQIFPQVIVPSIFCVKVANVLDVISGDVSKDEFKERLDKVLISNQVTANSNDTTQSNVATSSSLPSQTNRPTTTQTPATGPRRSLASKPVSTDPNKTIKEQIAEESIKRHQDEQLKKKKQEKEDRDRIKRLLKADEDERKADAKRHAEEKERQRRFSNDNISLEEQQLNSMDDVLNQSTGSIKENIRHSSLTQMTKCTLSIRLLDGHSIKHEFKLTSTLNDVRQWVDENRSDGDQPYAFHRTVPRITYEITDEEKTLESLELVPRCALILKPYQSYSNAYDGSSQRSGFFNKVYNGFSAWFSPPVGNSSSINASEPSSSLSSLNPSTSNQYHDDVAFANSPEISSHYTSPMHSPSLMHTNQIHSNSGLHLAHPSALNLNLGNSNNTTGIIPGTPPLRPNTPGSINFNSRIRTLNDHKEATLDDRVVYNGNQLDLEDDKSQKKNKKKDIINKTDL